MDISIIENTFRFDITIGTTEYCTYVHNFNKYVLTMPCKKSRQWPPKDQRQNEITNGLIDGIIHWPVTQNLSSYKKIKIGIYTQMTEVN